MLGNPPRTFGRGDMIFLARLDVARRLDQPKVYRGPVRTERIGFDQAIVAVEIDQVALVPFARQVGDITIPVQQVKGRICLLYTSPSPRDVEESRMPSSA